MKYSVSHHAKKCLVLLLSIRLVQLQQIYRYIYIYAVHIAGNILIKAMFRIKNKEIFKEAIMIEKNKQRPPML